MARHGIKGVISRNSGRTEPLPINAQTYRECNKIERFFGRLKQYRRLATPNETPDVSFLAFWSNDGLS